MLTTSADDRHFTIHSSSSVSMPCTAVCDCIFTWYEIRPKNVQDFSCPPGCAVLLDVVLVSCLSACVPPFNASSS